MRRFIISREDIEPQQLSHFEVPETLACADASTTDNEETESEEFENTADSIMSEVTNIDNVDASLSQLTPVEDVIDAGREISDLELAAESFKSCVDGKGSRTEFKLASAVYARSRAVLGMKETCPAISMENYTADKHVLAFESVVETIRAVGKAILKAIIAAIEWFKKIIRQFTKDSEALIKATATMTTAFKMHRQKNADKLKKLEETAAVDYVRYVDLMLYKKALTLLGAQPPADGGYSTAVKKITALARTHELLKTNVNSKLISSLTEVLDAKGSFIEVAIPDTRLMLFDLGEPVYHACGITAQDTEDMFAFSKILGDHVVITQFKKRFSGPADTRQSFEALGATKLTLTKENSEMMDGWLRKLTDSEVDEMFIEMTNLAHVIKDHGKTEDIMVRQLDSLKAIAVKSTAAVTAFGSNQFATTAQINYQPTLSLMTVGINSLVAFINTAMLISVKPARELQIAWLHYLRATIEKEKASL